MDFGRLPSPDGVDFALPALPDRSRAVLATGRPQPGRWLMAGAPVWARRPWLGTLYPHGTAPSGFLAAYAARVGALELDATFHQTPSAAQLEAWAAATPTDFRFCPKLGRAVSHGDGSDADAAHAAAVFVDAMLPLGDRLGPLLLQLPPGFGPGRAARLDAILGACGGAPIAVELRHPGWFVGGALIDPAADLLTRHGASAAVTDVAGRRDVCHATLTAPWLLVRFAGDAGPDAPHPIDLERLDRWLDRLLALRAAGLERAWFFVHQPDDHRTPETLIELAARAAARGVELTAPRALVEPSALTSRQLGLFGR